MGNGERGSREGLARRDMLKLAGAAMVGIGGAALVASPVLAATVGPPPGVSLFTLTASGITPVTFSELDELRMSVGREPGAFELVFTTDAKLASDFYAWFTAAAAGKKSARRAAVLTGYNAEAAPVIKWNLTGAFPTEIVAKSVSPFIATRVTILAELIAPA
jgi:hypothetical protein